KDTEGERRPTRSGPPRPLLFTVAALASAALVVAIVFGVMWRNAAGSDELKIAEARDEVTATANRAAAVFLEFDHTRSDRSEERRVGKEWRGGGSRYCGT